MLLHRSAVAIDAVGVNTESPKLRPLIVTDPPEVTPAFGTLLMLTQGAGARIHTRQLHAPRRSYAAYGAAASYLATSSGPRISGRQEASPRCEMVLNGY